jgi:hypothetical protein
VSEKASDIGNPLAIHRGEKPKLKSWQHVRLFSFRGLKEIFEKHGFRVVRLLGAGYYPLPSFFAGWDPRHAAFLTIEVCK